MSTLEHSKRAEWLVDKWAAENWEGIEWARELGEVLGMTYLDVLEEIEELKKKLKRPSPSTIKHSVKAFCFKMIKRVHGTPRKMITSKAAASEAATEPAAAPGVSSPTAAAEEPAQEPEEAEEPEEPRPPNMHPPTRRRRVVVRPAAPADPAPCVNDMFTAMFASIERLERRHDVLEEGPAMEEPCMGTPAARQEPQPKPAPGAPRRCKTPNCPDKGNFYIDHVQGVETCMDCGTVQNMQSLKFTKAAASEAATEPAQEPEEAEEPAGSITDAAWGSAWQRSPACAARRFVPDDVRANEKDFASTYLDHADANIQLYAVRALRLVQPPLTAIELNNHDEGRTLARLETLQASQNVRTQHMAAQLVEYTLADLLKPVSGKGYQTHLDAVQKGPGVYATQASNATAAAVDLDLPLHWENPVSELQRLADQCEAAAAERAARKERSAARFEAGATTKRGPITGATHGICRVCNARVRLNDDCTSRRHAPGKASIRADDEACAGSNELVCKTLAAPSSAGAKRKQRPGE